MTEIDFPLRAREQRLPNLVVWLSRVIGDSSHWVVDRVNVNGNGYKHNIDFATGRDAETTLASAFWRFLAEYLPKDVSKFYLNARDAVYETSDILMQRLNVTSRTLQNGTQRVLITFRDVLGDLCRLFQPGQFPSILLEAERSVATRTLTDVILPALKFAAAEPIDEFEREGQKVSAFVKKLHENRRQIELYAGLINSIRHAAERPRALRDQNDEHPQGYKDPHPTEPKLDA